VTADQINKAEVKVMLLIFLDFPRFPPNGSQHMATAEPQLAGIIANSANDGNSAAGANGVKVCVGWAGGGGERGGWC